MRKSARAGCAAKSAEPKSARPNFQPMTARAAHRRAIFVGEAAVSTVSRRRDSPPDGALAQLGRAT